MPQTTPYRGVFPVVPTVFDEDGALDLDGQRRAVDFMIDAGSDGLCILANFSEQFVLTDEERERVMDAVLRPRRRPGAGDRHHHPLRHRASAPSAAAGRRKRARRW